MIRFAWIVGMKKNKKNMLVYICKHTGVSGGEVHWMRSETGKQRFWCRRVVAIFGSYNTTEEYRKNTSPFVHNFQDNYVEGKGNTPEEALKNMEKEMESLSESLWT